MDEEESGRLTAESLGDWLFVVLALVLNLVPSLAYQIAPGGEVGDKQELFITVYLITLPLSVALTAIIFIWLREPFGEQGNFVASCVILLISGYIGLKLGTRELDEAVFSKVNGHPVVVLFAAAFYILFSYAIYYGVALFLSAVAVSSVAGLWLHERLK
jgi:hypothetical protein